MGSDRPAEEAFGAEVSPNLVSQLLKDLEPAVDAFRTRPLEAYPYLLVDARFDKVRAGHRVCNRAFLWAAGVNEKGSARSWSCGKILRCTQNAPTMQNGHSDVAVSVVLSGGPGAIRTPDPQIRRQILRIPAPSSYMRIYGF